MTREEFYSCVTTWTDLLNVADAYGFEDNFESIADDGFVCARIMARARDISSGDDWERFALWVSSIPRGHGYLEYDWVTDGFREIDVRDFNIQRWRLFNMMLDCENIEGEYNEGDEFSPEYINAVFDEDYEEPPKGNDGDDYKVPEEVYPIDKLVEMCHADIKIFCGKKTNKGI